MKLITRACGLHQPTTHATLSTGSSTPSSLSAALAKHSAVAAPDAKRLILMGHSAGNHVIVERLVDEGCEGRVAGAVLVDAVDGEE